MNRSAATLMVLKSAMDADRMVSDAEMTASRRWPTDFALTPVQPVDPDREPAAITVQVEPEELTVAETATASSRMTTVNPSREARSMPAHVGAVAAPGSQAAPLNEEEDARRRGVERLEQLIGTEEARAIMGTIPPFRWEELATKDDLARGFAGIDQRFAGIDQRFAGVDQRFAAFDARFAAVDERLDAQREELVALRQEQRERFALLQGLTQQTRTMVLLMAGTVAGVGALAIALAGLA